MKTKDNEMNQVYLQKMNLNLHKSNITSYFY